MGHEQRNLDLVERWASGYNRGGSDFVAECYAEDAVVDCPGVVLIRGREAFTAIEDAVCAAAPRRWFRIDRALAQDDIAVVQATLFDPDQGEDFETRFCAVLTFDEEGMIVNDTTYLDAARWPMPADVAQRVEGLTVEWKVPAPA